MIGSSSVEAGKQREREIERERGGRDGSYLKKSSFITASMTAADSEERRAGRRLLPTLALSVCCLDMMYALTARASLSPSSDPTPAPDCREEKKDAV